jgi:hypothetical protein
MRIFHTFPTLLLAVLLAGCGHMTERRAIMPGRDPDQVWNAMVAVAQAPDYASSDDPALRWTVRQNDVWADADAPGGGRIEVFRRLERNLHMPLAPARHETREWKLSMTLEKRDPPTILFQTRNAGVPAHAWEEAERFFDEVAEFLGPPPGTASMTP